MKKILLIGSSGSLATQINKTLLSKKKFVIKNISRRKFNYIKNFKKLENVIKKFKPNFILNCAALVGSKPCESNPSLAYEVNYFFSFKLANVLINTNIKLIHFSTETVFEGRKLRKIYSEDDTPNPISIYGKSKLLGEMAASTYKNTLIIRLPLIFGPTHKKQIVSKMLSNLKLNKKIRVAKDVYYTPSFSPYIAEFLFYVINENEKIFKKKLIHFHSNNYSSLSNFIKKLAKMINKSHLVISVKDDFFKHKNIKPKNLGLKSKYHLSFWKKNKININDKNLIKYVQG